MQPYLKLSTKKWLQFFSIYLKKSHVLSIKLNAFYLDTLWRLIFSFRFCIILGLSFLMNLIAQLSQVCV